MRRSTDSDPQQLAGGLTTPLAHIPGDLQRGRDFAAPADRQRFAQFATMGSGRKSVTGLVCMDDRAVVRLGGSVRGRMEQGLLRF
jgi:hypothetical protein